MPHEDWLDVRRELPEEETTVLVYLDCDHVTLGIMLDGAWETTVAPWESPPGDCVEVLYWRPLPWPPAEPAGAREPAAMLKLV